MSTVLITGCGSGFGFRLAATLHQRGHVVVATDPDVSNLTERLGGPSDRLHVHPLDVRSDAQLAHLLERIAPLGPVDVLINNAGYAVFGTIEETPLADVQGMFEVNVFGLVRVTQALLPQLRACGGTVVQLSSVAGRMVFPESGFYAASKFAVEAVSEALFQEVLDDGVRIRLIEPGAFATRFPERAAQHSPPRNTAGAYAERFPVWDADKSRVLEPPQDPDLVVDAIVGSLDDARPFLRIPVGLDAQRILASHPDRSPQAWQDRRDDS